MSAARGASGNVAETEAGRCRLGRGFCLRFGFGFGAERGFGALGFGSGLGRGFGFAALQDPRVQALLNLPDAQLLREMRVATSEGKIYGGAEAVVHLAGRIWWAWPFYAGAKLPGVSRLLEAGYRWFADHRTCAAGVCQVPRNRGAARALVGRNGDSR